MLFAFVDYQQYKRKTGRFARDLTKSIMGGAFEGLVPETAVQMLRPGDVLVVQTLERFASWAIMYVTQSEVSHVVFYVGDRKIAHATPARGVVIDPIETLFAPNTRLLPCVWPMPDEKRAEVARAVRESYEGRPYGWIPALRKGMRILVGRDWPAFRWSFFVDISLFIFLLDLPFLLVVEHPVLTWLMLVLLSLIAWNAVYWRIRPLKFNESTAKPTDILRLIQFSGGSFLFDGYAIQQQASCSLSSSSTHA